MARPYPTDDEILAIRADLLDYLQEDADLQTIADRALTKFKIDLEDRRGVEWSQVWDSTNVQYFVGSDGKTRNDDKIPYMISLLTIHWVFADYSINMGLDSQWWTVAEKYLSDYNEMLRIAKLDVDYDDSGSISLSEDAKTGLVYLGR